MALHDAADVPLTPCGIDEARKFQENLSDFQILIYAAHLGSRRIFTGPTKPGKVYCAVCSVIYMK